jgi:tetratricopeptide (TPR) repeat protein
MAGTHTFFPETRMPPTGWFLQSADRRYGPLTEDEMRAYFRAGMVKANDVVHAPDREAAISATEAAEELGMPAPPPLPVAPKPYEPPRKPVTPVANAVATPTPPAPAPPATTPSAHEPLVPPPPTANFKLTERGPDARWPIALWIALLFGVHLFLAPRLFPARASTIDGFAVISFVACAIVAVAVFALFAQLAKAIRTRPPRIHVALAALSLAYVFFGAQDFLADKRRDPAGARVGVRESLQAWDLAAEKLDRDKDYAGLLELSDRWVREHNDDAYAWMWRGFAHDGLKQYPEALRDQEHALALAPDKPWAMFNVGDARSRVGNNAGAIEMYERGNQRDPGQPRVWNNLGNAYGRAGRVDDQVVAYERALALDPKYALAWSNLAIAYRNTGRPAKADEAAARARALGGSP